MKLALYLSSKKLTYVQENPVVIKRSSGVIREKNDRVDSMMIARYAWLHREELTPGSVKDEQLLELGRLLALRDQLVKNRAGLKNSYAEMKKLLSNISVDPCCKSLRSYIDHLSKQIHKLEARMKFLIRPQEELARNFQLFTSLKEVCLIAASQLIYQTNNFKRFDSWRKFSNYCGTAPFGYSSGTSISKRRKCHPMGDRK